MPELTDADVDDVSKCLDALSLKPKKPKKFRWIDSYGRQLTAGGILPYDDDGVWVLGEQDRIGIVWTDAGGKYQFEDGDILKTIAREVGEETYHVCDMTRGDVVKLYNTYESVYVNGHKNKPVYICLVVPRSALPSDLNNDKMLERRKIVIASNPDVPPEYYSSVCIRHLTWDEINQGDLRLSYRLKRILRYGPLGRHIKSTILSSPPSSPPPPEESV